MRKLGLTTWVIVGGGLLVALCVVAYVTMLMAITGLRDSSDSVQAADARISLANELERRVIDVETGQRGFVITGQPRFLQPRSEALRVLPGIQDKLIDMERESGSASQVALLERLYRNLDAYIREYSDPLVETATGDLEAASRMVSSGEGRRRVDAIRGQFTDFIRRDGAEASADRAAADDSASTAVTFAVIGLVGVPLLILILIVLASRTVAAPVQRIAAAAKRLRRGDLTARVEEEGAGEVRSLAADFNEMATSLQHNRDELESQVRERQIVQQEAERLKNEFFALVSHELRTPLTSITGYLDIVRDEEAGAGEINDDQRHYLSVIDRNARRLMRLVGDLLFVAQIEGGRLTLKKGEVRLGDLAADAVEAARPQAEKQGVQISAETEPVTMHGGDPDRIGQLIDNLVSNAIKFTPEGGSVTVRLRAAGDRATIEVADTGMGISEADQKSLFDRFYRTDDAAKQAIPGIGLGLSISKAIAEGHGGSISLRSEEGRGTTFTVELPLGPAAQTNGGPPKLPGVASRA